MVWQGFFFSVLVINGFSWVSIVDFALDFASWLILVFLFLLFRFVTPYGGVSIRLGPVGSVVLEEY